MREELEPCPFCGTTASHGVVTEGGEANPDFGGHFIQCDNPNCHGCMGLRFACGEDPKPHLAAAWNTRAPTEALTERASMAAEIERLKAERAEQWRLRRERESERDINAAVIGELKAEIERLSGLVQGWHYLAVGPDEMGDYHTQKQLIKLSEPYASPALKALKEKNDVA